MLCSVFFAAISLSLFGWFSRALKQPFVLVLTRWFYCTNSPIANKHIELKEMVFVRSFFLSLFVFSFSVFRSYRIVFVGKWLVRLCNRGLLYVLLLLSNKQTFNVIYLFLYWPVFNVRFYCSKLGLGSIEIRCVFIFRFYDYWIAIQRNIDVMCSLATNWTLRQFKIRKKGHQKAFCHIFFSSPSRLRVTNLIEAYEKRIRADFLSLYFIIGIFFRFLVCNWALVSKLSIIVLNRKKICKHDIQHST